MLLYWTAILPKNSGFCFQTDAGISMVENHVNSSYVFDEQLSLLPFGGN
jgi:hypothetical protein